jgi:outer membrane protein TolC
VYDLTQARLTLNGSRMAAIEAARAKEEVMARLATALGLPRRALDGVNISFDNFRRPEPEIPAGEVRRHALVNRSDILAALAEYAASQSALQLEIAKQYPDIRLGPGYQLDQTDSKWTIGLAIDLPILSRNRGPIAEAEARRTESAARFLALQSRVVGELDAAVEDCRSALLKAQAADDLLANLTRQGVAARTWPSPPGSRAATWAAAWTRSAVRSARTSPSPPDPWSMAGFINSSGNPSAI